MMKQQGMTVSQCHTVRDAFHRHGNTCWKLYVGTLSGLISKEDARIRLPYLEGNRRRLMRVYGCQHKWRHALEWSVDNHDKLSNLMRV